MAPSLARRSRNSGVRWSLTPAMRHAASRTAIGFLNPLYPITWAAKASGCRASTCPSEQNDIQSVHFCKERIVEIDVLFVFAWPTVC